VNVTTVFERSADNFNVGMSGVVLGLFTLLIVMTCTDLVLESRHLQPIGRRFQRWSRANPVLCAILLCAIGALLAHFCANRIVFNVAPNS
jgi:Na+/H+ antiporter NhaD/arsenite permease-like protein